MELTEHEQASLIFTRGMSAHAVEWLGDGEIADAHVGTLRDAVRFVGDRTRGVTLEAWALRVMDACKIGDSETEWFAWLNQTLAIRDQTLDRLSSKGREISELLATMRLKPPSK